MDFGPRDIPKSKDPFWDPPEAVEIGKAYVYLKALSQLVEIESDFAIVDYKGDEQGQLSVSIFPEGPNGEDLDYLATSEELIGKPLTLLVRIPEAKGLPAKFNNDVFVNFAFMDQVKETEACEVKTTDRTSTQTHTEDSHATVLLFSCLVVSVSHISVVLCDVCVRVCSQVEVPDSFQVRQRDRGVASIPSEGSRGVRGAGILGPPGAPGCGGREGVCGLRARREAVRTVQRKARGVHVQRLCLGFLRRLLQAPS